MRPVLLQAPGPRSPDTSRTFRYRQHRQGAFDCRGSTTARQHIWASDVLTVHPGSRFCNTLDKPLDDGWVLIASATGQEKNPDWYYNLKARPTCTLLVPHRGEIACIAREAEGPERERAWLAANTQYSGYAEVNQTRTQRRIPVMILVPAKQA
jgi:deazaflavin-dependent oxidoreductase (nitroreductase family)